MKGANGLKLNVNQFLKITNRKASVWSRIHCVKRLVSVIGFLLAMTPSLSHAETTMTWDFRKPEAVMPEVDGLMSVEKTTEGLHIHTLQDGLIGWRNASLPKTDAVYVYMKNSRPAEAAFMWQPKNAAPGDLLQLFFTSPKTDAFERVTIVPSEYDQWTEKTPVVAFGFPAGTDLVIQKIEWKTWGAGEKALTGLRSMVAFDMMSQRSINFLWGPLFTMNQATLDRLYDGQPPRGVSALRIAYGVLIGALVLAGTFVLMERKRRAVLTIAAAVAGLWLLLDVRMGAELLGYAMTDIHSYVLATPDIADLRTIDDATLLTDRALDSLGDADIDSMVLLEPAGERFVANVRLRAYPLEVIAYADTSPRQGKKAWLVLHRPDITAENGMVSTDTGRALSSAGKILEEFGDDSFLFLEQ